MSVSGLWSSQNRNGLALDALVVLLDPEGMKTTTTGQVNAVGRPQGIVDGPGKANTRVKRADRQQPRRWTESLALS